MAKAYVQVKTDLADAAAVIAYVSANPSQFTLGTIVCAANGNLCIVTDDEGTALTITAS